MTAIVVAERITGSSAVRGRVVTGARAGMSVREFVALAAGGI